MREQPQQRSPQQPPVRELPAPPARKPSERPAERPSDPPTIAKSGRRRWLRWILFALLPLALIAGGYWYVTGGRVMSTDNSYVEADKVGVSTDVSGIVKEVDVDNNQQVAQGQVLFRLDDLPFRLALDRATAQVGIVRNDLNALKANYRDMQAQIMQAQNDIDYYDREFHRQQDLAAKNIASQQTFDTARRNLQNAQQKLASLNQQLAAIAANLNGNPDIAVEETPAFTSRPRRSLPRQQRQLDHAVVRAPFDGIVTQVNKLQPGMYLLAPSTAFGLVASDQLWVEANLKETDLTTCGPASRSPSTSTPIRTPSGTAPSTASARPRRRFSVLPAQNATGNWVKVVQRVPVRVQLDTSDRRAAAARGHERRGRDRHRPRAACRGS